MTDVPHTRGSRFGWSLLGSFAFGFWSVLLGDLATLFLIPALIGWIMLLRAADKEKRGLTRAGLFLAGACWGIITWIWLLCASPEPKA